MSSKTSVSIFVRVSDEVRVLSGVFPYRDTDPVGSGPYPPDLHDLCNSLRVRVVHVNSGALNLTVGLTFLESHLTGSPLGLGKSG